MALRAEAAGVSVRAIVSSRAVILAMDAEEDARAGLLGFALGRETDGATQWMRGFKFFKETVPAPQPGERRSTLEHPIQSFMWGDYASAPDQDITYVVKAVYGSPASLTYGPPIRLRVKTPSETSGDQSVIFNRGAIPSQAFADRFNNVGPTEEEIVDPSNEKVKWLSRGLLEAALAFIGTATGREFELRVAAYEFYYPPILAALRAAASRGATVRISFDGGDRRRDGTIKPTDISIENYRALMDAGLDNGSSRVSLHPRTLYSAITHNKFIVLRHRDQPIEVWTGSTNFTASGFLGQSNVAHIVRRPDVAERYDTYWEALSRDEPTRQFKAAVMALSPDPASQPVDIATVFSPRRSGMIEWYAARMGEARQSAMLTAAFGVAPQMAREFAKDRDYLRFVLMERRDPNAAEQAMVESDPDTLIAVGAKLNSRTLALGLDGSELDRWFKDEEHFRTKGHVFYIHTKFLLIDALGSDPLIFTGSANFSDNSVESNDENMLLIGGAAAQTVAGTYTAEFQRLFNHLYFRTVAIENAQRQRGGAPTEDGPTIHLRPNDGWVAPHFAAGTLRDKRRRLFR